MKRAFGDVTQYRRAPSQAFWPFMPRVGLRGVARGVDPLHREDCNVPINSDVLTDGLQPVWPVPGFYTYISEDATRKGHKKWVNVGGR